MATTLTWWAWRLGHSPSRPGPTKPRSSAKKRPAIKLVEVALEAGAAHMPSGWELRTPDGIHLTVHGPISADAIAILIGASRRRE